MFMPCPNLVSSKVLSYSLGSMSMRVESTSLPFLPGPFDLLLLDIGFKHALKSFVTPCQHHHVFRGHCSSSGMSFGSS